MSSSINLIKLQSNGGKRFQDGRNCRNGRNVPNCCCFAFPIWLPNWNYSKKNWPVGNKSFGNSRNVMKKQPKQITMRILPLQQSGNCNSSKVSVIAYPAICLGRSETFADLVPGNNSLRFSAWRHAHTPAGQWDVIRGSARPVERVCERWPLNAPGYGIAGRRIVGWWKNGRIAWNKKGISALKCKILIEKTRKVTKVTWQNLT